MFHTILISPHHDDVALSTGAMAALGMLDEPLKLVTVFSESDFAPLLPTACSVAEISEVRSEEDSRFASFIGASTLDLGWQDAPLRFPNAELGSLISNADVDEELVLVLSSQIQDLVATNRSRVLLAPMGQGGHVDHLTLRSACEKIRNCEVLYYLDQPYAGMMDSKHQFSGFNRVLELRLQKQVRELKLKIASFFPSQPAAYRMMHQVAGDTFGLIVESIWKTSFSRS